MKIIEIYNNKFAEKYDRAALEGQWSAPNEIKKLLSEFKLVKNNLVVLDLGVGTGQTIRSFIEKSCKIFAVDISGEMLMMVKRKYPKIKILKRDINNGLSGLYFKNKYFDIIIATGVLEFIKNIGKIIKETHQLLKNDGYFIFTYELLLNNNKFQKLRVQYNAEGYIENPSNIAKFKLYRRSKEEINKFLDSVGYKVIRHFKIRAFLKGPSKIPVYYGVVLVKR